MSFNVVVIFAWQEKVKAFSCDIEWMKNLKYIHLCFVSRGKKRKERIEERMFWSFYLTPDMKKYKNKIVNNYWSNTVFCAVTIDWRGRTDFYFLWHILLGILRFRWGGSHYRSLGQHFGRKWKKWCDGNKCSHWNVSDNTRPLHCKYETGQAAHSTGSIAKRWQLGWFPSGTEMQ